MKKAKFFAVGSIVLACVGFYLWESKVVPNQQSETFSLGEEVNWSHSGSVVIWNETFQDSSDDVFVRDFQVSGQQPIYLCKLNFEAAPFERTAFWSQDRTMCVVRSKTTQGVGWKVAYDWKLHRLLHPSEIGKRLATRGGLGEECQPEKRRMATLGEAGQFAPATNLN